MTWFIDFSLSHPSQYRLALCASVAEDHIKAIVAVHATRKLGPISSKHTLRNSCSLYQKPAGRGSASLSAPFDCRAKRSLASQIPNLSTTPFSPSPGEAAGGISSEPQHYGQEVSSRWICFIGGNRVWAWKAEEVERNESIAIYLSQMCRLMTTLG